MDCYKQLRMEISGFKKIICSYSKKSSAAHILPELETALIVKDKEAILYGLDVIIEWYNNNISEIRSNQYVTNLEEHIRTHQLLKKNHVRMNTGKKPYKCEKHGKIFSFNKYYPLIISNTRKPDAN